MSINMLHDDVLLDIFDFYVIGRSDYKKEEAEAWQTLTHVCRQWRIVVLESLHRLNLRLYCTTKTRTPVDVWPDLPLRIEGGVSYSIELDNIIAVLERSNRVYHIDLAGHSSYLEIILPAMQKPFPELTYLRLSSEAVTVVVNLFLGGSAPRLQELNLRGIPFPGLPKLLSSATHLTHLFLFNIPHIGYFSPEAIVTALSTLTSLRQLCLEFESPRSLPHEGNRHPPSLTRSVLPALNRLTFKGVGEYLEDLAALIDAPRLDFLHITMFNQIYFDTPQSIQFMSRTPKLTAFKKACLIFMNNAAAVVLSSTPDIIGDEELEVNILCKVSDWQVSSLEQVCNWCLPPLSALEDLDIYDYSKSPRDWGDNIENSLWVELLHPFSAVKNLYISAKLALCIGPALEELVGSRTMEVLPVLQNIFLEGLQPSGHVQEGIVKFIAARELSGRPITVSMWRRMV